MLYYIINSNIAKGTKMKTCCFTGHRIIPRSDEEKLKKDLYNTIFRLISEGYDEFICGGARGFDTLCGISVLAAKNKYPHIKLRLIIPCADQDNSWNEHDKLLYRYLLERADSKEVLHESYVRGCMHERNRKMVDASSVCIAYLKKDFGGTKFTVDYARKNKVEIILL